LKRLRSSRENSNLIATLTLPPPVRFDFPGRDV
jgi:hypothetical protein